MEALSKPGIFEVAAGSPRPLVPSPRAAAERRARESSGEEAGVSFPDLMSRREQQAQPAAASNPNADAAVSTAADGRQAAAAVAAPEPAAEAAPQTSADETLAVTAASVESGLAMELPIEGAVAPTAGAVASDAPAAAPAVAGAVATAMPDSGLRTPETTTPAPTAQVFDPAAAADDPAAAGKQPASFATDSPGTAGLTPADPKAVLKEDAVTVDAKAAKATEPAPATSASALEASVKGRESYARQPVPSEAQLVAASLKESTLPAAGGSPAKADAAVGETLPLNVPVGSQAGSDGEPDADSGGETAAGHSEKTLAAPSAPAAPAGEAAVQIISAEAQAGPTGNHPAAAAVPASSAGVSGSAPTADTPATATAGGTTPSQLDPTVAHSVRQQVVRGVGEQLGTVSGGEKITIKLNPESLGQIELSFEAREDRLSVVISASTREAEAALHENLKDLTDRIVDRSSRFSHVEIRVDARDGAAARQEAKQDEKQEGRQDQRRENSRQDGGRGGQSGQEHPGRQAHQARLAWESAMSWQLADQAAGKEG